MLQQQHAEVGRSRSSSSSSRRQSSVRNASHAQRTGLAAISGSGSSRAYRHTRNAVPIHARRNVTAAAAASNSNFTTAAAAAAAPGLQQQQPQQPLVIPALAPTAAAAASAAAVMYDAAYTADTWSRRPVPVVARLLEILAAFGGWWASAQIHRDAQRAAADMRTVLVNLGPAFVKIGQALSSRPDVLPPEYLRELELLQDRIPPFSDVEALQVIEEELGVPWRTVFSSLSSTPVAAASLGQVYRGRLAVNGAEVAVKVQRPGVVDAIGRDTFILRNLAAVARRQLKLNTDLPALVDEWAASLFKELDYTKEAANGIRFAELFSFMPEVAVPHMYTEYTTPRVLVMEWIEGERLRTASQQAPAEAAAAAATAAAVTTAAGSSVLMQQQQLARAAQVQEDLRLVEIGVRCSLEQMLEEGFYHADPHPGNLLKTKDGQLAYLDFGMMGEIQPAVRQALIRATLHLVNREYERLAEDFVVLGLLPQGTDMDDVIPALTGVFQKALSGGVSNISFSTLSSDLGRTMYKYSFQIPPYYTLLVRSLSVLEGIALASDPNYKVLGAAYPWVSRRLLTQNSPELHATLNNLLYSKDGQFNFDRLESLLEQAAKAAVAPAPAAARPVAAAAATSSSGNGDSSGLGLVRDSVISGFLGPVQILTRPAGEILGTFIPGFGSNGSSATGQQQYSGRGSEAAAAGGPLALVLSPEGSYIRGILENELAKGLDAAWRLAVDQTLDDATHRIEGLVAALPVSLPLLPPRQQPLPGGVSNGSSRVDLLQTLMSMPKLADAEDRTQVDGLSRLATQLANFSTTRQQQQQQVVLGSSSSILAQQQQQQQQQSMLTDQLQQTSVVLNWLASEVQLLSPAARREALAIPFNILNKLASRLAARAVRAILTPAAAANGAGSSSNGRVFTKAAGAGRVVTVSSNGSSVSVSSSSSNKRGASPVTTPSAAAVAAATVSSSTVAANGSSSSLREPLLRPVTPEVAQQQQQPRRQLHQGRKQPKTPPQRQLVYNPEVQPVLEQQQQRRQQQLAGDSSAAAAAALARDVDDRIAPGSSNGRGAYAFEQSMQQQQQQQQWPDRNGSSMRNGSGSTVPKASSQRQQQQPLVLSSSIGNGSSMIEQGGVGGSSSSSLAGATPGNTSADHNYTNGSSRGVNYLLGNGNHVGYSRTANSSSSSNGWVDEVVVVEADAVLEPADTSVQQ